MGSKADGKVSKAARRGRSTPVQAVADAGPVPRMRPVCAVRPGLTRSLGPGVHDGRVRAITALSERPLESGRGVQTYVSLRASPGKQAVTVYLAPLVYSPPSGSEEEPKFFLQGAFSSAAPAHRAQPSIPGATR